MIEALYRASQAGVPIDIVDRGICCLRPGMPGISETIRVRSVVERFLEHSRVYVFGPDSEAQVYLASADWMPRNFYRRVEVMFPVESPELKERILHEIIPAYLLDNVKARALQSDGSYCSVQVAEGATPYRCQERLLALPPTAAAADVRASGFSMASNGLGDHGNGSHGNGSGEHGMAGNGFGSHEGEMRPRTINPGFPTGADL